MVIKDVRVRASWPSGKLVLEVLEEKPSADPYSLYSSYSNWRDAKTQDLRYIKMEVRKENGSQ